MGIAPHIARLRSVVGCGLRLLPAVVPVMPVDDSGRVLLDRLAGRHDGRGIPGGAIDPGESPGAAAIREAREPDAVPDGVPACQGVSSASVWL